MGVEVGEKTASRHCWEVINVLDKIGLSLQRPDGPTATTGHGRRFRARCNSARTETSVGFYLHAISFRVVFTNVYASWARSSFRAIHRFHREKAGWTPGLWGNFWPHPFKT